MPPTPLNLLRPLYLLSLSAFFLIPTTFDLIKSLQLSKFFSWPAFQDEWFAHFWSYFGPLARQNADAAVKPLMKQASGIVIDVGPGSGQWLDLFDRSNVSKIYGVEPNAGHHAALRANVKRAGLDGVYEIIGAGVEDLENFGIAKESVDTVVTVQVLCSVPGPRSIIMSLYPYLKPGGKWIVYEHVKTKHREHFVSGWQSGIDKVWPHFFGGCSITRPTDEWLLQAGPWEEVSLKPGDDEGPYDTIPHVKGFLIKRGS